MTWGAMSFSDSETDISSHDDIGVKEKKRKKPQEGHGTKSRRSYSSEPLLYDASKERSY